ncbi:hypothetical protein C8R45DRAFT_1211515 [Mycena sanguinolenta]|nr:hypothetical protein C8R45DRAFT_1211515 [Mycena sanguinolenta]
MSPAKRKRTENTITHSEIWYKDGSVVLQAENTQFCVYWGILCQHSPFFRDLESSRPPNQPTVDGCPIVELQDSVADVEYLLKSLYDPHFLGQTVLPLAVVGALIRLGRKYDFQTILDSAMARITFENPATLEAYDALIVNGTYKPTRITESDGFAFDMLRLVRENNILSALPIAYYRASRHKPKRLLDGIQRKEGTLASLAPLDLSLCLTGRKKLLCQQIQPEYTLGFLLEWQAPGCRTPSKCGAQRKITFGQCSRGIVDSFFLSQAKFGDKVCAVCCKYAPEANAAGRKKSWEELPAIFDLPAWDQLKK